MSAGSEQLSFESRPEAISINELYNEVEGALSRAFPRNRTLWVRGEIQSVSDRTGHCYLDLVDPDAKRGQQTPTLKVRCWRTSWVPLKRMLAREGITLEPGLVVVIRGALDVYRPRAELGFILAEIDVSSLVGRIAANRAALLRALETEGLLEANRGCDVPAVPLHVGLVASRNTEGYRDFVKQIEDSGFGFRVSALDVSVQGHDAPHAIARAVRALSRAGVDLTVVVRGGGSKADLQAFDAEPVARAIAGSAVPVWTGIGHTGDQSVADIVANRAFITPTDCGWAIAQLVAAYWHGRVVEPARFVSRAGLQIVGEAIRRDEMLRRRLVLTARHLLGRHHEQLEQRRRIVARAAPRILEDERRSLLLRTARLAPLCVGQLERAEDATAATRRLMGAYDVGRQLERGYTLTLDREGNILRNLALVAPGATIVTRFADGTATSTVNDVAPAPVSKDEA